MRNKQLPLEMGKKTGYLSIINKGRKECDIYGEYSTNRLAS